jgi:diaminopimelate decarboxylase
VSRLSVSRVAQLRAIAAQYGTPVYVYDAEVMRQQLGKLRDFDRVRFAQKACSNIHVLKLLREAGASVDCVSPGELERALAAGFLPGAAEAEIVYTADLITRETLERVIGLGVPVNAGSEDMVAQIGRARRGHPLWLRVNPGFGHGHSKKTNTGGESSKHGIWHEQLPVALKHIQDFGLQLVGLHMHIGSGADIAHLRRVCDAMFDQIVRFGLDVVAGFRSPTSQISRRSIPPSTSSAGIKRASAWSKG